MTAPASPARQVPTPEVQAAMNAYWSRRSAPYDDYQQRPERRDADRAAWNAVWRDALGSDPLDVLDVGTGSGYVATVLAELGHRVHGIDLADGMIARARQHAEAMVAAGSASAPEFTLGDAVAPPFASASFDALVNRYVMWTLREPATALQTWRSLLRPGGTLAVVDSTWFPHGLYVGASDDFHTSYGDDVRSALPLAEATSIEKTAALIEAAGFVDVEVVALTSILELDRAYGVAPNHEVQLQHLVRATRPVDEGRPHTPSTARATRK